MEKMKNQVIRVNMTAWELLHDLAATLEERYKLAAKDAPEDPELKSLLDEMNEAIQKLRDLEIDLGMCFVKLGKIDLSKF